MPGGILFLIKHPPGWIVFLILPCYNGGNKGKVRNENERKAYTYSGRRNRIRA